MTTTMEAKSEARQQTARQMIRNWLAEQITGQDKINVPTLAREALDYFKADRLFLESLAEECLPEIAAQIGRQLIAQNRFVWFGDTAVARDAVAEHVAEQVQQAPLSPFAKWFEHVGERYVNLKAMTKADLLTCAVEREGRANEELRRAAFMRTLAERLKADETVGHRFNDAELQGIWQKISQGGAA